MKKFRLEDLKVESFVTALKKNDEKTIIGGTGNRWCVGKTLLDMEVEMAASEGGVAGYDPNDET